MLRDFFSGLKQKRLISFDGKLSMYLNNFFFHAILLAEVIINFTQSKSIDRKHKKIYQGGPLLVPSNICKISLHPIVASQALIDKPDRISVYRVFFLVKP